MGHPAVDAVTQEFGATRVVRQSAGRKSQQYFYVITFPPQTNMAQVITAYQATGALEYVEHDAVGGGAGMLSAPPNDLLYNRQWALANTGSFALSSARAGADMDMERAWSIEQGDSSSIVAVIDAGAKMDHPEFAGRIWINRGEIPNNGIDDDNNGYVDDVQGWNFVNGDNNPTDDHGHGTNVAGIIGANAYNNSGYAGVDWNCKLMILKGLDSTNNGLYSMWIAAIIYAVDNGARVINVSLGGTDVSTAFRNAVEYALSNDVIVVASMMNTNSNAIYYPAAYAGVIAVGSSNPDDSRSNPFHWSTTSGSNFGDHISVIAPGAYIYGLNYQSNTNHNTYWSGTSQAAPHVAGLAALLLAQDPLRTPAQIKSLIESTAEDRVGPSHEDVAGWDPYFGHGRINAFQALSADPPTQRVREPATPPLLLFHGNLTHGRFSLTVPPGTEHILIANARGQQVAMRRIPDSGDNKYTQSFELRQNGIYFIRVVSKAQTTSHTLVVNR